MIQDENQVQFIKKIAEKAWTALIFSDYGEEGLERLPSLTGTITQIYKHFNVTAFEEIIIYVSLDESLSLENLEKYNYDIIQSYTNLAGTEGRCALIEVTDNQDLLIAIDQEFDLSELRTKSVVYNWKKGKEKILGKDSEIGLDAIPNAESYFSVQTYKELEDALQDYKVKVAMYSESCPHLKTIWIDDNKLFLRSKPEHIMRNSLSYFLKIRLRNTEVRPEQIVDRSHPVDIKVTWNYSSKLALLEIKWLGKSKKDMTKRFSQIYTHGRALEGAQQLADYLDGNKVQAPDKTTRGYLIIFDGRRWGTNRKTTVIDKKDGFCYQNKNIKYDPDFSKSRRDFAKPVRFFMEPICTLK